MSTCTSCGRDLTGPFCSTCGTPAPAAEPQPEKTADFTASDERSTVVAEQHADPDTDTTATAVSAAVPSAAPPVAPALAAEPPASAKRNRPLWMPIAAAMIVTAVVAGAIGFILSSGSGDVEDAQRVAATVSTTTTLPTTTTTTVVTTTASVPPTTVLPARNVLDEPAGQFCRDLAAKGYSYSESVAYWNNYGQPTQMDASGTGIPCQSVYPRADVVAHWGANLIDSSCPGSSELEDAFLNNAEMSQAIELGRGFQGIRCTDGWVIAFTIPIVSDGAQVYFHNDAGLQVVDGGTGLDCFEVGMSAAAEQALCD